MHLVSLESTQEARIAQQLLRFSRALQKHISPKGPSVFYPSQVKNTVEPPVSASLREVVAYESLDDIGTKFCLISIW